MRMLPAADVVEAEQQARQGGFAGAAGADGGDGFAGRDGEADVVQNRAVGIVGKAHMVERHFARHHVEFARVGRVFHFARPVQQREHALDIGDRFLDLAIHHAQKTQRLEHLQQKGVDHHQVAQRQRAVDHAIGGAQHHQGDADGDDAGLRGVQVAERTLRFERHVFPFDQAVVVARGFVFFVAEILHRFVVEQAVDGAAVGFGIERIGFAHELGAPLGDGDGKADVGRQRHQREQAKHPVELDEQDAGDQQDFQHGGRDAKQQVADQARHRLGAALDVAGDAAGLAFEMKAQRQRVQMLEYRHADAAHRALGDLGENHIAQVGKGGAGKAQHAIAQNKGQRQHQFGTRLVERVDDFLEHQRHRHRRQLGADQQRQRDQHAAAKFPQIGKQAADRAQRGFACRGGAGEEGEEWADSKLDDMGSGRVAVVVSDFTAWRGLSRL